MSLWFIWIIVAFLAATLEIFTASFGFIFITGAAFTAFFVSIAGLPLFLQLVVFATTLISSTVLIRPSLLQKINKKNLPSYRGEQLIGLKGIVTEALESTNNSGRVSVSGEDWAAKSFEPIPAGKEVIVDGIDGIFLTVSAVEV